MKYKVTLYLEANTHPRKWVPETIWEALDDGEDILDYRIEQYEEDKEFIEEVYEIAFGDDAINRDFSYEEVLEELRDNSDRAWGISKDE